MRTCQNNLARKMGVSLAAAVVLAVGSVHAQQGPVTSEPASSAQNEPLSETQAAAVLNYWTPERMKAAREKPFPRAVVQRGVAEVQSFSDALALDQTARPGYAPGWRPGQGKQPAADARVEIALDDPQYQSLLGGDLTQTTPPFVPPATPADFNNYAPFQRFTWRQSDTTAYPVSTVGKLFFTQRGINFVCSASVINRSTLATAGHCVHDGSNSAAGWSTNVLFCPSFNPAGPSSIRGCWAGRVMATSFQWFSARNIDRDIGCIVTAPTGTVHANRVGNITGWLGRAWNWPSKQSTFAWGYPQGAPFAGNRVVTTVSTEWYQLNRNASEAQLSKYIGNDMTGGSSGGPWWINHTHGNVEIAGTDASQITDPNQGGGSAPWLNGVNSHKRCTAAGCPAGTVFTQEMGSPQFRNTLADNNESEDVFAACFNNGGTL
jgi:V8-like Glu-specific endopeptidase